MAAHSSTVLLTAGENPTAQPGVRTPDLMLEKNEIPVFLSQQLKYAHLIDTLPYVDALSTEQHEEAKLLIQQEMAAIRKNRLSKSKHCKSSADASSAGGRRLENSGDTESEDATATERIEASEDTDAFLLQEYLSAFPIPPTPHLDDPNTLAGREFARLKNTLEGKVSGEARATQQGLDLSRYEAVPVAPSGAKAQESAEWKKSADNCESLLEHLALGQTNLELMTIHAASIWTRHLRDLSLYEDFWNGAAKRLKRDVDNLSKARKLEQVESSTELRSLAHMREDYELRNHEILQALGKLHQEVIELKMRCSDRGLLPEDYDSDIDEELEEWEALLDPLSTDVDINATQTSTSSSSNASSQSSSSTGKLAAISPSGVELPNGSASTASTASGSSNNCKKKTMPHESAGAPAAES